MPTAFLGIGANLGDRLWHCERVVEMLRDHPGVQVTACSPWKTYPALTRTPNDVQPDFVNGVVQVATTLSPEALLAACHAIERQLGRQRREGERWASRTIDIDILIYDDLVMTTSDLTIPHPELTKRLFVLEPLAMLAPGWVHPVQQKTIAQLLSEIVVTDDGRLTTDDRSEYAILPR